MSNTNTGGPVFPCRIPTGGLHANDEPPPTTMHFGMTMRDYFAAKAMDRLLELWHRDLSKDEEELNILDNEGGAPDAIAEEAYAMANAMLRAREAT